MLTVEKIREGVGKCLVKSGTTYRADQFEIYKAAIEKETNKSAKWVLERLVEMRKLQKREASRYVMTRVSLTCSLKLETT